MTIIKKYIEQYLHKVNSGLRLVLEPIMPRMYANKLFEHGILKTVRLIRYNIPEDDAERYGLDRNVKEICEERVLRKPAGFIRNNSTALQAYFNKQKHIEDIVQINGFKVDDLKLEFKNGERVKTISLKNLDSLVVSEDITKEVMLENGHPVFNTLCDSMKKTGEYYLRAKGALI